MALWRMNITPAAGNVAKNAASQEYEDRMGTAKYSSSTARNQERNAHTKTPTRPGCIHHRQCFRSGLCPRSMTSIMDLTLPSIHAGSSALTETSSWGAYGFAFASATTIWTCPATRTFMFAALTLGG